MLFSNLTLSGKYLQEPIIPDKHLPATLVSEMQQFAFEENQKAQRANKIYPNLLVMAGLIADVNQPYSD